MSLTRVRCTDYRLYNTNQEKQRIEDVLFTYMWTNPPPETVLEATDRILLLIPDTESFMKLEEKQQKKKEQRKEEKKMKHNASNGNEGNVDEDSDGLEMVDLHSRIKNKRQQQHNNDGDGNAKKTKKQKQQVWKKKKEEGEDDNNRKNEGVGYDDDAGYEDEVEQEDETYEDADEEKKNKATGD